MTQLKREAGEQGHGSPIDVGIYLDMRNPPQWRRPWGEHYAAALEAVELAERLGARSVWLSEHHFFTDGYLPQPLTLAAAIAARTQRLEIGTAVLLPNLRHPIQLAEEAALVDILSGGRLQLGLGVGYRVVEHEAFGSGLADRYEVLESRVRQLRQLWAERVSPPPVQSPIPIWGGFFGPRGAALAGRLGLDLLAIDGRLLEPYHEARRGADLPPRDVRMRGHLNIVLADDPERVWQRCAPHFAWQLDSYNRHSVEGTGRPVPEPVDVDRLRTSATRRGRLGVWTVDEAVAHVVDRAAGLPVDEVFFWASVANLPDEIAHRHVELVCTDLRQALAARGAAEAP
jgi:alkanesulfonate monooxygenase SsuD/methylene tetrahydromethanopterin reductase-like flavin-dependent oxidoreductase (luciferase family)